MWRLTASNFGQICKITDKGNIELLCENLFNPPLLNNLAVNHGKTYENLALKKFEQEYKVLLKKCGLFVNSNFPYLGCSPDAIIDNHSIIEVKCPFNGRNSKIAPGKNFLFLEKKTNGQIGLKKTHSYYFQVLGQLAITKCERCFFVVFTFEDFFVEEIFYDEIFFSAHMLPKLKDFYEKSYKPFIASKL